MASSWKRPLREGEKAAWKAHSAVERPKKPVGRSAEMQEWAEDEPLRKVKSQ